VIYFKEYESSESRIPALRVEFDKERAAMESHITSLRRQVCFVCLFVCLFACFQKDSSVYYYFSFIPRLIKFGPGVRERGGSIQIKFLKVSLERCLLEVPVFQCKNTMK